MSARTATEISLELVGQVYDCAVNPGRWQEVLGLIAGATGSQTAQLFLTDSQAGRLLLNISHGIDDYWLAQQSKHLPEVETWTRKPSVRALAEDDPLIVSRHFTPDEVDCIGYIREWGRPQGLGDGAQLTFLRTVSRQGGLGLGRPASLGPYDPVAVDVLRRLAPHIRRAVQVCDLLEMKSIENELMASALDRANVAVVLVDTHGKILHASALAGTLLDEGLALRAVRGHLTSPDRVAATKLSNALRTASQCAEGADSVHFGIKLPGRESVPCVAHVLPLLGPLTRSRVGAPATAAVFVTRAESRPLRLECLAAVFNLTPSELNVLAWLADGRSTVEAASRLGVAESTVRTHVKSLHRKIGVERQSELVALVHRLLTTIR